MNKVLIFSIMLSVSALMPASAGTFGNDSLHLNRHEESYDSSFPYEYQYGERFDREQERDTRTGRDVNYYYVPRRAGTDECSRYNRNYIECR